MKNSELIKRRRLWYGMIGFIIGLGMAVLIRWLIGGGFAVAEAVVAGLFGSSVAMAAGQTFRGLPTQDDLALTRLREEMSPMDLASEQAVPRTLRQRTRDKSR